MSTDRCQHCHRPVPAGAASAPFCCRGCEAVHALLIAEGLGRYYELAGDSVAPSPPPSEAPSSHAWLEPLVAAARGQRQSGKAGAPLCELRLDVQGIHCSACVWLLQETFRRRAGAGEITVNPALGQLRLRFDPARFEVEAWVRSIEAFGYRFGPARKTPSKRSIELPLRLGISAALTVNVMLFSVSFYFGLAPDEPQVFRLFSLLSLALSSGVVAVGGWPFFRSALQALRRGVLHLDLPIALGIVLVFASSVARMRHGRGDWAYFDTLDIFITLMLAGRFLQERLLERNRKLPARGRRRRGHRRAPRRRRPPGRGRRAPAARRRRAADRAGRAGAGRRHAGEPGRQHQPRLDHRRVRAARRRGRRPAARRRLQRRPRRGRDRRGERLRGLAARGAAAAAARRARAPAARTPASGTAWRASGSAA